MNGKTNGTVVGVLRFMSSLLIFQNEPTIFLVLSPRSIFNPIREYRYRYEHNKKRVTKRTKSIVSRE